ncbi:MAG: ATP-binding protein [Candidatus Dadabacteria bacterium]|nr:ATP-binding protein [Candidatus Dadabacteria bacterium]
MPQETFKGQVRVAARIIDLLSSGLYPNPAACLKELINNAYDADATLVEVFVKPEADQIVIRDNGDGFTKKIFKEHFSNVSESSKRKVSDQTSKGRKKIGKIGIGFIAANELCEEVEVFSTCKGSTDLMHVTLNFSEMSKPPEERRGEDGKYRKADYSGVISSDVKKSEHYTELYLKKVKGEARRILTSALSVTSDAKDEKKQGVSLYGLYPETVEQKLQDRGLRNWEDFDFYSQTMLQVALNIPIQYHENWHPDIGELSYIESITQEVQKEKFSVKYDGSDLRKPIVLHSDRKYISEQFHFSSKKVSAKGHFFATHGTLLPSELQGLLIRIRGSAVGTYSSNFLGFPQSEATLFQRWITCEIYASDELEEAMNIDRVTFRDTHPAYVELRNEIFKQLRAFLKRVHDELYIQNRDKKRQQKHLQSIHEIRKITEEKISQTSPSVAKSIEKSWTEKEIQHRKIVKNYSPWEVLEMVSDTAQQILPKPLFEKLMSQINERLLGRKE